MFTESSSSPSSTSSSDMSSVPSPITHSPQYLSPQPQMSQRSSPDSTHMIIPNNEQICVSTSGIPVDILASSVAPQRDRNGNILSAVRMHRKHVGMRYLFPPLPDSMNLLDKTRIWVERHTHGYYVGWSEEQLKDVDQITRPLVLVTENLYKQHMNR